MSLSPLPAPPPPLEVSPLSPLHHPGTPPPPGALSRTPRPAPALPCTEVSAVPEPPPAPTDAPLPPLRPSAGSPRGPPAPPAGRHGNNSRRTRRHLCSSLSRPRPRRPRRALCACAALQATPPARRVTMETARRLKGAATRAGFCGAAMAGGHRRGVGDKSPPCHPRNNKARLNRGWIFIGEQQRSGGEGWEKLGGEWRDPQGGWSLPVSLVLVGHLSLCWMRPLEMRSGISTASQGPSCGDRGHSRNLSPPSVSQHPPHPRVTAPTQCHTRQRGDTPPCHTPTPLSHPPLSHHPPPQG